MTPTKAILGAVLAGLSALLTSLVAQANPDAMTVMDWVLIILSAAVVGLGVYLVPNKPTTKRNPVP